MIERTLQTMNSFTWEIKALSVIIAFLAPLSGLIHVIIGLLVVDMFTSVYYQMKSAAAKVKKGQRFKASIQIIESGKLRKTLEKMFFYVLILIVFYSFDTYVLQIKPISPEAIYTFSVTNLSAVLISLVEMTSIAANVSKITGNPVFDRIIKIFSKKVDKKFEIEE